MVKPVCNNTKKYFFMKFLLLFFFTHKVVFFKILVKTFHNTQQLVMFRIHSYTVYFGFMKSLWYWLFDKSFIKKTTLLSFWHIFFIILMLFISLIKLFIIIFYLLFSFKLLYHIIDHDDDYVLYCLYFKIVYFDNFFLKIFHYILFWNF